MEFYVNLIQMSRRKIYQHLIYTDFMGIRTKIKNFVKPHKKVTKGSNK